MKIFKIILCFLIFLSFVSCGAKEFYNIYSFVDNYNKIANEQIDLSNFYFDNISPQRYTAVLGSEDNEVLLTLKTDSDDNITEINISLIKSKNNLPSNIQSDFFREVLVYTLYAFCNYEESQSADIIRNFTLDDNNAFLKEGELTLKKDNFYFVYYSTKTISQVMIYNTYIQKIEDTQKPVSKPYFAEDFIIKETP